jgi:hypothetical protein
MIFGRIDQIQAPAKPVVTSNQSPAHQESQSPGPNRPHHV